MYAARYTNDKYNLLKTDNKIAFEGKNSQVYCSKSL